MIKVYTAANCQPCRMTKVALTKYGIPFEEIEAKDPEVLDYLHSLGAKELPVVVHAAGHWTGFQPSKIKGLTAV